MAVSAVRFLRDQAYYLVYGNELNATPDNLKWALQQAPAKVLNYRFKEDSQTYTILEYAVRCGDVQSAKAVIDLGVDREHSPASEGSIAHFYMTCLKSDQVPNMEMLELLLDKIWNIDMSDAYGFSVLARALKVMGSFRKIHHAVIEELLKRGAAITKGQCDKTPFEVLVHSHGYRTDFPFIVWKHGHVEENMFLGRLVDYLELEKKYHPDSESTLTVAQFKFFATYFISTFMRSAVSMSSTSSIATGMSLLNAELEAPEAQQSFDDEGKSLTKYRHMVDACHNMASQDISQGIRTLHILCDRYGYYFEQLVKQGTLDQCVEPWVLNSIKQASGVDFTQLAATTSSLE
jgi:hypothetical protein